MAYAAVASLSQTIDLILSHQQDSISPRFKNQIISIDKYIILLRAFLEDFPKEANGLEERIREVTHLAEDNIEFLLAEEMDSAGASKSKSKKHKHHDYDFQHLEKVTAEIESIAESAMEVKDSIAVEDGRLTHFNTVTSSSKVAPIHKDAMVGFDGDLMEIKSRLCGESSKLRVVPIVGMAGIGKTTLARNVYDDQLITEHFHIRLWVTLSQDYSFELIVLGLLVSMKVLNPENEAMKEHNVEEMVDRIKSKENHNVEELDAEIKLMLEENVYKNLRGKRYLIVLDDVWSRTDWDGFKTMFPDDGNGSRILLTTRLSDVASYANPLSLLHEMQLMDDDESWNLLRQKVFKQDPCPNELWNVGKIIARSCKGLPLAIVVISGILVVDQTAGSWWNIAKNVMSTISGKDEQIDNILSLSYTNLPHHLRPCFLYLGGFPEDHEVRVSKVVKLWVAEGFLKPSECGRSFEETAEEYLEDLVKRNLVLVSKRKSDGRIKSFNIHDLMRNMCIRKAREEKFFQHVSGFLQQGMRIPRRLSIAHLEQDFPKGIYDSNIHTVIVLQYRQRPLDTGSSLRYFRLLRILDLRDAYDFVHKFGSSSPTLPAEVFELFHLRYLALDHNILIPAAISNLRNLQTLIIAVKRYGIFIPLPVEIWRVPQLRHILVFRHLLPSQEGLTFPLENLQTLSIARDIVWSGKTLKMMPNLKKLTIWYDKWRRHEDYELHNLEYLQLEKLQLKLHIGFPCPEKLNPVFPRTLRKLSLVGWKLHWKDMTIVGSLPNLQVLKLRDNACVGDTWETNEGEFCQLKFLLIDGTDLQDWVAESNHFPRLKCLVLRRCRYLSGIPDGIGEIPTLELLEVDDVNKSLVDMAKRIQADQQDWGNDALQVRCLR